MGNQSIDLGCFEREKLSEDEKIWSKKQIDEEKKLT